MRRTGVDGVLPVSGPETNGPDGSSGGRVAALGVANAMTIDVEEYFQVSAFATAIARSEWDKIPSRIEESVDRLLALFAANDARCTFFTLGWIAERHPTMIRRIVAAGHELASHGYSHRRVTELTPAEFRDDVRLTKGILEDVGGVPVAGFRAASFSLDASTSWAHEILAEEGYGYSSSIYPVRHDHYGLPNSPRFVYWPSGERGVPEIPMTTVRLFERNFPSSGGGYFRLLPCALFCWAIRRVNARDAQPAIFYFHPWEIDARQPRQLNLSAKTRFRHYVNLDRAERKLRRLLRTFTWDRMDRVMARSIRKSP